MASIDELAKKRKYDLPEDVASKYISNGKWIEFLKHVKSTRPSGKARDAIVGILDMEAMGI